MAQAVSGRSFISKVLVLSQVNLWWIEFSPSTLIPVCIIAPMFYINISFMYHRRYIILAVDSVVK